ncbi:MAG: hypothetical protein JW976_01080 [Syntrophaceae bacterium]|nr:hypothetical protein [Syntrophaceae bacterium]
MKKNFPKIFIALAIMACIFTYVMGDSSAESQDPGNKGEAASSTGMLENVLLAKLPGKERVHLVVSRQPERPPDVKNKVNGSYLIKLEDIDVLDNLCRTIGEGELDNITKVVPSRQLINGKNGVYINIYANKVVPYSIRQEGQDILIDFNVSGLDLRKTGVSGKAVAKVSAEKEKTDILKKDEDLDALLKQVETKKPTERIVSLDFQDADIKSVFRLMAEYGNVSIITSDEVKGNITLAMKNVPWTKALETILDVNSLTKREEGNIIIVSTRDRKKKDDDAKLKEIADEKKKREEERLNLADKGMLKQIMIEAKIVEATEGFVRNLGIQWGFGTYQSPHISGSRYGVGVLGGSSTATANQQSLDYPSQIGIVKSGGAGALTTAAVNFPAALSSPAIGLVFGGATGFIEAQIAALENNNQGKIISSPKVVTMEGITASIKQGDEVPYITPASGTSPATVAFKEALLKLDVTPKLTPEGKISMKIKASNDTPDWSKAALNPQGNPPIVKSEVDSTVVINDGETIVIGGILKSTDTKSTSGWPWLQKIPVLGWLFKKEDINREKRQLLIFVTPKVLQNDYKGENQESLIKNN